MDLAYMLNALLHLTPHKDVDIYLYLPGGNDRIAPHMNSLARRLNRLGIFISAFVSADVDVAFGAKSENESTLAGLLAPPSAEPNRVTVVLN